MANCTVVLFARDSSRLAEESFRRNFVPGMFTEGPDVTDDRGSTILSCGERGGARLTAANG